MPGLMPKMAGAMMPTDCLFDLGDSVSAITWAPDGDFVAASAASGAIAILDPRFGTLRKRLPGHNPGTMRVTTNGGLLASSGEDGAVKLWNPGTGELIRELEGGAQWVEHLAFSPCGSYLAAAAGKRLQVWRSDGTRVTDYNEFDSTVSAICWRPDGKGIGAACYGRVQLIRIGEERPYENLEWRGSLISLAWSPSARFVAAGSQEASVRFWKLPYRPNEELVMSGYGTKVRELAWDAGSRFLATGGGEIITVWDISGKGPAGTRPRQLGSHKSKVTHLMFQNRGRLLASAGSDGNVILWHPGKTTQPVAAAHFEDGITNLAWSPDDTLLAIGTKEGAVSMVRVIQSAEIQETKL